ncbi:MAG: hypothetical protein E6J55_01380 [Deltaproteobacteria bacterium]|nr:MAG: hypothetical protein E6J55_01380 [Deltaproteobacteria bacterium]
MKGLIVCLVAALLQPVAGDGMCADMTTEHPSGRTDHFRVVSNAKKPSPEEIATDLEATWRTFRDLFGVEPAAVEVVITVTSGGGGSSADAGTESPAGGPAHRIAWTIAEGEPLDSQRFSDLSHEIAHIYFLEYMHAGGLHQAHAWLHEAVACHHEKEPSRRHRLQWMRDHLQERIPLATLFTMKNPVKQSPLVELTVQLHEKLASRRHRLQWMRDHLQERIPLATLFTMKNPVKQSPLVELTVQLHEKLARGEITVDELNRQISAYASSHAEELSRNGIRNMTYYAESLSLFEFLLETEGKTFIREMCQALRRGTSMDEIVRRRKAYPNGLSQLEDAWVAWVRNSS